MRTYTLVASLLAVASAPAIAQNLELDKVGGALGGTLDCPIHGNPNEPYALLLDIIEQQTLLPQLGVTLDITDQFAWLLAFQPNNVWPSNNCTQPSANCA